MYLRCHMSDRKLVQIGASEELDWPAWQILSVNDRKIMHMQSREFLNVKVAIILSSTGLDLPATIVVFTLPCISKFKTDFVPVEISLVTINIFSVWGSFHPPAVLKIYFPTTTMLFFHLFRRLPSDSFPRCISFQPPQTGQVFSPS
jgi:hypothetical protein